MTPPSGRLDPVPAGQSPIPLNQALLIEAASVCWAAFLLILLLTMSGKTQQIDMLGLQLWRAGPEFALHGPAWLATAARDITSLGGALLGGFACCVAAAILFALKLRREAAVLLFTVVTGWIFNNILKAIIGRPRPDVVPHLTEAIGLSFPSGHSFTSAAVYISITLAFMSLNASPRAHRAMVGTAILLSLIIALSRVALGVHYPSDIMAGWLAGSAWALTIKAISLRRSTGYLSK